MDDAIAHCLPDSAPHGPFVVGVVRMLFTGGCQLEHHGRGRQQYQGMHRDQGEQRHQSLLAKGQAHERYADHGCIAEHAGQSARRSQSVEAVDQHRCHEYDDGR